MDQYPNATIHEPHSNINYGQLSYNLESSELRHDQIATGFSAQSQHNADGRAAPEFISPERSMSVQQSDCELDDMLKKLAATQISDVTDKMSLNDMRENKGNSHSTEEDQLQSMEVDEGDLMSEDYNCNGFESEDDSCQNPPPYPNPCVADINEMWD